MILIPHFIDGDSDQLDPCFAAFKRINWITALKDDSANLIARLKLTGKALIRIDSLFINIQILFEMSEFYKDKEVNFILKSLQIDNCYFDNISDEEAKFINKISPKIFSMKSIEGSIENIKALVLLNCTNIEANFINNVVKDLCLWFIKTPIQIFDSKYNKRLTFEWESIKVFIGRNKTKNVKFFKANTGNFLFIPLEIICRISCLGFREKLSAKDINRQFTDLGVKNHFDKDGFIVPMRYSNRIFVNLDDEDLNNLNQYKDIYQIFKEKHIKPIIENLNILLEIKKIFPNDFSRINFKYYKYSSTEMWKHSISRIMNSPDLINLKFWEIYQSSMLSPDELQFWWKMLQSSKTRFSLTSIYLKLKLLSECLTVLSLCSGCPELEFVELKYLEADAENKDEVIEQAKREIRNKIGFIQKLTIWNFKER